LTNPENREKERLKSVKWRQENKDRIREYTKNGEKNIQIMTKIHTRKGVKL